MRPFVVVWLLVSASLADEKLTAVGPAIFRNWLSSREALRLIELAETFGWETQPDSTDDAPSVEWFIDDDEGEAMREVTPTRIQQS